MLNEVKVNILRDDCDCDYVLSEASLIFGEGTEPFIRIFMYVGEGLENPQCRMWANGDGSETWLAYRRYYTDGILAVLAQKEDFDKVTEKGLVCEAINNGELIGKRNVLFFPHDLSDTKEWQVTRYNTSAKTYVFDVTGIGTSSGGSGGGGGGGGGTTYTAGSGINISESDEISTKIDSKTIQFDADGKMYVPTVPLTLENAVVIQEADAKYLLHEYTQVEYIAGNKIGYAGAQNQIIAQGYIIYKSGGTAPNGVKIEITAVSDPSGLPDIPMYTDMPFSGSAYYNNTVKTVRAYMKLVSSDSSSDNYSVIFAFEDGTERAVASNIYNHDNFQYGMSFVWTGIYPPGYTVSGVTHPYGAVQAQAYYKAKTSKTGTAAYRFQPSYTLMIDFASEAEYNAAVGLTYEPQTLTQVNETVTEV